MNGDAESIERAQAMTDKQLENAVERMTYRALNVLVLGIGMALLWVEFGWKVAVAAQMFAVFLKGDKP